MIIILMGVAGCGKTTVGELLAEKLSLPFHDADDFHPEANIQKMSSGVPLNDDDRWPWLDSLCGLMPFWEKNSGGAVLACSALRQIYRDRLSTAPCPVLFIYLKLSREVLEDRLFNRADHYMKPAMLDSQLATLEVPTNAVVVNAELPVVDVIQSIYNALSERSIK